MLTFSCGQASRSKENRREKGRGKGKGRFGGAAESSVLVSEWMVRSGDSPVTAGEARASGMGTALVYLCSSFFLQLYFWEALQDFPY